MALTCIAIAFGFSLVVILTSNPKPRPGEMLVWMAINGIITSAVSYALARLIYRRRLVWAAPKAQKETSEEPVAQDNS
jgi:RsiW-degrading membrane proteinase PrsW (M82 family)